LLFFCNANGAYHSFHLKVFTTKYI